MPLQTVIIGCGQRGMDHVHAIATLPEFQLCGAQDVRLEAARRAGGEFGARAFQSISELLTQTSPDYAIVATPPEQRLSVVHELLKARSLCAIAVEKPMASSMEEARQMIEACRERSILLLVCHQLRFSREFALLKEAVDAGDLGSAEFARGVCYGNLWNQGAHIIDALRWLMGGQKVAWVMSQACDDPKLLAPLSTDLLGYWRDPSHPGPMWMSHTLGLEDGRQAALQTGLLFQKTAPDHGPWLQKLVNISGSHGMGEARVAGHFKLVSQSPGKNRHVATSLDDYLQATRDFHKAVAKSLTDGTPHPCDAADSIHSLEALLACAQSGEQGAMIRLPLSSHGLPSQAIASKTKPNGPRLSIILPLADHRGFAIRCVTARTRKQLAAGHLFELIVLADGTDLSLEAEVKALLRPHDQLIQFPTDNELHHYDIGARAANGEIILCTEPHCVAEPEAVQELLHYMDTHDMDGCCIRSTPMTGSILARMESRMYDEGFMEWSRPESWCKVILRGFAIRRQVYLDAGGFEHRFDRFSEWALAATLHQRGCKLGYAPGSSVAHHYTDSLRELKPFIRAFTRGECQYRLEFPRDYCNRYFGQPPEWESRNESNPALAAHAARIARQELWPTLSAPGSAALKSVYLRAFLRNQIAALLGDKTMLLKKRFNVAWAQWRCLFWRWHEEKLFRAYLDYYQGYTECCRVEFLAEQPPSSQKMDHPVLHYRLADLPGSELFGFHASESANGEQFRWSSAISGIRLNLDHGGFNGVVHFRNWGPKGLPLRVNLYLNSSLIFSQLEGEEVHFRLPEELLATTHEPWLFIAAKPFIPRDHGSPDTRELGLPIVSMSFEKAFRSTVAPQRPQETLLVK